MNKTAVATSAAVMARFDLNLLRVLVALDDERSVTRAAERVEMSQSGFSMALARLREHLHDPLFVRTQAGMVPTPRAARMVAHAREALAGLQASLVDTALFDPQTSDTEFRIAMTDLSENVVVPQLVRHLQRVAPHVTLRCVPRATDGLAAALESGEVDLALGLFPELAGQAFVRQRLWEDTWACVLRRGHPLAAAPLTAEAYASLGQARFRHATRATELVDRHLRRLRIEPRVVVHTDHLTSLLSIVAETDLAANMPLAASLSIIRQGEVTLMALPFEPPRIVMYQHWHRLFNRDLRHAWLRAQVAQLHALLAAQWREREQQLYGGRAVAAAAVAARAVATTPATTPRKRSAKR